MKIITATTRDQAYETLLAEYKDKEPDHEELLDLITNYEIHGLSIKEVARVCAQLLKVPSSVNTFRDPDAPTTHDHDPEQQQDSLSQKAEPEESENLPQETVSATDPAKRPKLLIIDGSSMLVTAYYANLPKEILYEKDEEKKKIHYDKILQGPNGVYTNAVYGMLLSLKKLLAGWNPDYLAVCFDKSRDTFRRERYPEYKAQRKETPEPLKDQFLLMEKLLAMAKIPVFLSNTYEADDLAGALVKRYKDHMTVRVVSKDRDYLQLVSDPEDVRLWIPATEKEMEEYQKLNPMYDASVLPAFMKHLMEFTEDTVRAYKGVSPTCIPDLKAIEGDASDNIPGVKGVSSAAAPLLAEYGTLEGIYDAIDSCNGNKKEEKELTAFWKESLHISRSPLNALKTYREDAFLSKDLATIRTGCMDNFVFSMDQYPLKQADFSKMNKKMKDLGIRTISF